MVHEQMICNELFPAQSAPEQGVDRARYRRLHADGRKLIQGWFERAWQARKCQDRDSFEPFVFSWIAFNAWAACVTGEDQDFRWRDALSRDIGLTSRFAELTFSGQSPLACASRRFAELWPVFKVQELRGRSLPNPFYGGRSEMIECYLAGGATKFEPKCWKRHSDEGTDAPIDWPHTLAALYRVRCNLFHGEKAVSSEGDQEMVGRAFKVLVHFLRGECLT